jgi:hypothetical protein
MLNPSDTLIQVKLYSPHNCDFIWQREDGTRYVHRKLGKESVNELHKNPDKDEWIIGEVIQ